MPIGSVVGGIFGSVGASKAAKAQEESSKYAADLQKQSADEALGFQKQQYSDQQKNFAPWLQAGTTAINKLAGDNVPGFNAPTAVTEQNDPGFQFRLQQGSKALQQSAAARGGVLSGATSKAINDYAQNSASSEYGNVYNRAMGEYNTNVLGPYNRLSALAGVGQQAAGSIGQAGQNAANQSSNIATNLGQQLGTDANNAGAARASGYAANANIWGNVAGGLGNSLSQYMMLNQLNGSGYPAGYNSGPPASYGNDVTGYHA